MYHLARSFSRAESHGLQTRMGPQCMCSFLGSLLVALAVAIEMDLFLSRPETHTKCAWTGARGRSQIISLGLLGRTSPEAQ